MTPTADEHEAPTAAAAPPDAEPVALAHVPAPEPEPDEPAPVAEAEIEDEPEAEAEPEAEDEAEGEPGEEAASEPVAAPVLNTKRWYVIKVASNREESTKRNIERQIKIEGWKPCSGRSKSLMRSSSKSRR